MSDAVIDADEIRLQLDEQAEKRRQREIRLRQIGTLSVAGIIVGALIFLFLVAQAAGGSAGDPITELNGLLRLAAAVLIVGGIQGKRHAVASLRGERLTAALETRDRTRLALMTRMAEDLAETRAAMLAHEVDAHAEHMEMLDHLTALRAMVAEWRHQAQPAPKQRHTSHQRRRRARKEAGESGSTGNVVNLPNAKIYQLGIKEGMRRRNRNEDDPKTDS